MLTLNDGRAELWQWDTGRTLSVDADCSQVHFSNKVFGRSIDVDVVDGVADIPDILLQTDKDLNVWAFVGTAENGYTKISKTFKINRRNKPADYVFTPTEQTTLAELSGRLDRIEESQDPDAIKNAVDDYLKQNPVEVPVQSVNGQIGAVELTAENVGAISQDDLQTATNEALAQAKASGEFDGADGKSAYAYAVEGGYTGTEEEFSAKMAAESGLTTAQINAMDGMFKVCAFIKADVSAEYTAFKTAFGIADSGGGDGDPDEPITPDVTLTSISATYSGGDVAVGTAVADLTGIVVTATYSDGSTSTVTGYTLSGEIVEGDNTIIVTYNGKTATFTVTGTVEHERVEHIVSGQTFPVTLSWSPTYFDVTPALAHYVSGETPSTYYDVEIDVESISSKNAYVAVSVGGGAFVRNASDYAGQTGTLKMTGEIWHTSMSDASQIGIFCNKGTETSNQTAVITGVRIYER